MRFLLSRRWLLFAIAVGLAAWGATLLGQWQFHRLAERKSSNTLVSHNLRAAPVPVGDVLAVGSGPSPHDEWRRVTVRGTWNDRASVVLKYQTRDGGSGVDIVTPLTTTDGKVVLVDRGWMGSENSGARRPEVPDATSGTVTVTGYVRLNGTGDASVVSDLATRAISSQTIAPAIRTLAPGEVYGGFLQLASQAPATTDGLGATELPDDTSNGPHFFYGLQWWFFGALAIFGFFFLMYDEWKRTREESAPDSGPK